MLVVLMIGIAPWSSGQSKKATRYQWQYDLKRAERQLRKSDAQNSIGEPLLRYAEVLFYLGKHEEALPLYRKADSLGLLVHLDQKRNYIYCGIQQNGVSPYAAKSTYFGKISTPYQAKKFGVNTDKEDFSPFVWNDRVFVTSSRPTFYNKRKAQYVLTRFPFLDVHAFKHDASVANMEGLPVFLNAAFHDGPLAIARDTSMLMLTRNYEMPDKNGTHHLYITVFHKKAKGWSEPERLFFCEPTFTVQHPYYDDAHRSLYFSSNMPGGKGGFDLYRIQWDGKNWSKPENLGPEINTSFDEVFPGMNADGKLYYATNHIETMGGLDLVVYDGGKRLLLPAPINSVYDDFGITFKDQKAGYFTSNRGNATFDDDIWQFEEVPPVKEPMVVLSVVNEASGSYLTGQEVYFQAMQAVDSLQLLVSTERVNVPGIVAGDSISVNKVADKEEWLVARVTYEMQGDSLYWIKIFVNEKPKPALPAPMFSRVYFHNDLPKLADIKPSTNYSQSYRIYADSIARYYVNSADARDAIDQFWTSQVQAGWQDIQQMQKAIDAHLAKGGKVEVHLEGYCSPLHTDSYNIELAKRRVEVVKRYLMGPRAIKTNFTVTTQFLGEAKASASIAADLKNAPASVYGIKASLERRVELKVVFK